MPHLPLEIKKGPEIGRGREKIVYGFGRDSSARDKQKVIKDHLVEYNSRPLEARDLKARFYLRKILHLLLPNNIPDMYAASVAPKQDIFGNIKKVTIEEKIDIDDPLHEELLLSSASPVSVEESNIIDLSQKVWADEKVISLLEELENCGIVVDEGVMNFAKDVKGDYKYLDTLDIRVGHKSMDGDYGPVFDNLREVIKEKLQDKEQEKALKYLSRLEHLYKDEELEEGDSETVIAIN